jgi:hypothetical protein
MDEKMHSHSLVSGCLPDLQRKALCFWEARFGAVYFGSRPRLAKTRIKDRCKDTLATASSESGCSHAFVA